MRFIILILLVTTTTLAFDLSLLGSPLQYLNKLSSSDSIQCAQVIKNITDSISGGGSNIPPSVMGLILNSGKGINDLGFYDACQNSTDTKYYTFRPRKNTYEKKAFYGMCLPSQCDLGTVNDLLTPYFSRQVAPGQERINKSEGQFDFVAVDPSGESNDEIQFIGLFAIALFSVVGTMSCIGSCFNSSIKKRDQREQKVMSVMRDSMGNERYESSMADYNALDGRSSMMPNNEGFMKKLTMSFDFTENFKKLFADNDKAYYQLTYLDGLRSMAIIYTIFANDYWARISISQNITDIYSIESFKNGWTYTFLVGAQYAIDVFLFVSGLSSFLAYSQLQKESKPRSFQGYVGFYLKSILNKWLSIAPLYFFLAILYFYVIPPIVDGPLNSVMSDYTLQCESGGFWYSLLLFGNVNINYQCMNWCWYLGVEFQAFFFLLIAVIMFRWMKVAGYACLGLWIVVAIASTFGQWYGEELVLPVGVIPRESTNDNYMLYFYAQSFTRWSAYMIGGIVGCILASKIENIPFEFKRNPISMTDLDKQETYSNIKNQDRPSIPSFINVQDQEDQDKQVRKTTYDWKLAIPCTIASLILFLLPIFCYRLYQNDHTNGKNWSSGQQSLFAMFGSWSVVLGVIVMGIPAYFGKKSVAMMFFGGSFWSPLSRLFFGMYMIHLCLIQYNIAQSYSIQYLDAFVIQNYMFADLFFGFLLAIVFVSLFEMPFSRQGKKVLFGN